MICCYQEKIRVKWPICNLRKAKKKTQNIDFHKINRYIIFISHLSVCFCRTHTNVRYFLPTFLWVLVIWITSRHHVSAGCKIVSNGEESGWRINSFWPPQLLKVIQPWIFHMQNHSITDPSHGNQQPLLFLQRKLPEVNQQKPPQVGARLPCDTH